jgi:Restriction endonuclease HincII
MKQIVDYKDLVLKIKGTSVPKPISGTLSGHAAGEPFDKHVYKEIKKQFPQNTFRQYEYLNDLYSLNPTVIGFEARHHLVNSPTVMFLLSRGKNATDKWSIDSPFDEKQNDTADILVVKDGFYEIIDIKTRNLSKSAQAPNIISAYKLAQVCAKMIDNQEFNTFTIDYFEIDWLEENDKLVCKDAHFVNLFRTNPSQLYINWAAAMQIQFHVCDLTQDFIGSTEEWAKAYLKHFVTQAKRRADEMIKKFVKPFEKYLDK